MLRALIWDVDGTVAETERDGHRVAFNQAFEELGVPWRWSVTRYGKLLTVTGGRERLLFDMQTRRHAPTAAAERETLARRLHEIKNRQYASLVATGTLHPRPGVMRLVQECVDGGVALAVATTTSRSNVDALFASLWGPAWRDTFVAVVCAEDAPAKKPDPLAYRLVLERLGVAAEDAFALEDSPNGLHAARAAGLRCGVTRSEYFGDTVFDGAAWLRDSLDGPAPITLSSLQRELSA